MSSTAFIAPHCKIPRPSTTTSRRIPNRSAAVGSRQRATRCTRYTYRDERERSAHPVRPAAPRGPTDTTSFAMVDEQRVGATWQRSRRTRREPSQGDPAGSDEKPFTASGSGTGRSRCHSAALVHQRAIVPRRVVACWGIRRGLAAVTILTDAMEERRAAERDPRGPEEDTASGSRSACRTSPPASPPGHNAGTLADRTGPKGRPVSDPATARR